MGLPDEHIWLQSKIRLKINHWRLSPEPPELAVFYVAAYQEVLYLFYTYGTYGTVGTYTAERAAQAPDVLSSESS